MIHLEQKLRAGAEAWLAEEQLSPERAAALAAQVRRRRYTRRLRRWAGMAATAAAVTAGLVTGPYLVAMASGSPLIGPYIARIATFDQGAHWADQKGFVVPVGKSATDQGYTFRVESVMADSARTVIYYVLEGPDLEQVRPFPHPRVRYNLQHHGGGASGRGEIVEGRLVGSMQLPPLPTPTSVVNLDLTEVGGVKGDWSLSFMASRLELDRLARSVDLNRRLSGPGYDLVVKRALLAPTQTIIEVEGSVAEGMELRPLATLTVSGVQIRQHMTQYAKGGTVVNHRFAFDRIDPDAAGEAVLSLTGLVSWQDGGPSLELKAGSRVQHGHFWMEFVGVEQADGKTVVTVRIPWTADNFMMKQDFEAWSVLDADGKAHPGVPGVTAQGDGTGLMRFHLPGEVRTPLRLQAGRFAEPVPGDFRVAIPLK